MLTTTQKIELILIFVTIITFAFLGMYWIMKQADKFFRKADEIEKLIKSGNDKDEAISQLMLLSKDSFHRNTGSRIRELGKMIEAKYNIEIFRK